MNLADENLPSNNRSKENFLTALEKHRQSFDLEFDDETREKLAHFYCQVAGANALLHLTAPSSAEDFVVRHILESLWLARFFSAEQHLCDVGAGAGLPSLPLLIQNIGWQGTLIESKPKKAEFLRRLIDELELSNRVSVVEKQFAETVLPKSADLVVCRALDKFTTHLKKLLKWSENTPKAFFGGETLDEALRKNAVKFERKLLPMSEKRFVFLIKN